MSDKRESEVLLPPIVFPNGESNEAEADFAASEKFDQIARINLIAAPTPIERCERLRAEISSAAPEIYIKRDDYQTYLVGGNKLRKLEFVLADALEKRARTILTCGSIHSNHARITAMVARRFGLKCVLVLNGEPPAQMSGNFLINQKLGVEIHYVETWEQRAPRMNELQAELESKGERVYQIPLGASNEIGALGFVKAVAELKEQTARMQTKFDAIIHATSSGGTQAGLEAGKRLFGLRDLQIIGISADNSTATIRAGVGEMTRKMASRIGAAALAEPDEIVAADRYVGAGYGIATQESTEAVELFARCEGILLDSVYTAKAAAGLIDYCRREKFGASERVLFWHTGGVANLMG